MDVMEWVAPELEPEVSAALLSREPWWRNPWLVIWPFAVVQVAVAAAIAWAV